MNIRITALCLVLACPLACQTTSADRSDIERYQTGALALLDDLAAGQPLTRIRDRAQHLSELSQTILGDFAVRYPPCGRYLNGALGVMKKLDTLTLEEIERDYHADGALPDAPDFCYHAKDLIVHPATVILLTREPDTELTRGRISAEIQEVRAHVGQVQTLLDDS